MMRSVAVALFAVLICVWSCLKLESDTACTTACENAEQCGLLPSPLGAAGQGVTDQQNCIDRCNVTSPDQRTVVTSCTNVDAALDGRAMAWCGDGVTSGSGACDQIASCLTQALGEGILGQSALSIVLAPGGDAEAPADVPDASTCVACNSQCGGKVCDSRACGGALGAQNATSWCVSVQAATAQLFYISGTRQVFGPTVACSDGLDRASVFDSLSPGPFRAGVKIRGASQADAGNVEGGAPTAPYCWVFYGPKVVLGAGETDQTVVGLLEPGVLSSRGGVHTCEDNAIVCADGFDNDGNGLIDCADTQCAAYCQTTPCPDGGRTTSSGSTAGCSELDAGSPGDGPGRTASDASTDGS
jgi:hypothetical protein